jgi:hypothetical protein
VPFHFVEHGCPKDYLQISMPTPQQTRCGISRTAFGCATALELDVGPANAGQWPSRRQHERDGRPCVANARAPSLLGLFAIRYPNFSKSCVEATYPQIPNHSKRHDLIFIATRGDLTLLACPLECG